MKVRLVANLLPLAARACATHADKCIPGVLLTFSKASLQDIVYTSRKRAQKKVEYDTSSVHGQQPFGQHTTRTKATESAYLKRALWYEGVVAKALARDVVSPVDVAEHAIDARYGWSKSNWKQIKASLVYRYLAMGTPDAREAVALLQVAQQTECLQRAQGTSAQRLKAVSEEVFVQVLSEIERSRSGYASFLSRWLTYGAAFGLRPHEWGQARLVWMRASEVEQVQSICADRGSAPADCLENLPGQAWDQAWDGGRPAGDDKQTKPPPQPFAFDLFATTEEAASSNSSARTKRGRAKAMTPVIDATDLDLPRWFLRVRNAKDTNGRAHGFFRHLDASGCPNSLLRDVDSFSTLMSAVMESGRYETFYAACQRLLLRVNQRLGMDGKRHVQLYSPRHKFSSAVKNRFSRAEVGAMMGHANDETATSHYGKRRSGHGSSAVNPVDSEVSRVARKAHAAPQRSAPGLVSAKS